MTQKTYDLGTTQGCMRAVVDLRHSLRLLVSVLDIERRVFRRTSRQIRLLRSTGNPMDARRADVAESQLKLAREESDLHDHLVGLGDKIFAIAPFVDANVPQDTLLDMLNVNRVDRGELKDSDGLVQIVFAHGLENSAEHRDKDWHESPMFQAAQARFHRELIHNREFNATANQMLFGRGGMFEFLPKYQEQPDGTMKRLPPPLRLADPAVDQPKQAPQRAEESGNAAA